MVSPSVHPQTPFTIDGYTAFLRRASGMYEFAGFDVVEGPSLAERRFCLIRHDIDLDPAAALRIAQIEADLGVHATYAVLLSGIYNPLKLETRQTLKAIAGLGHAIMLHFDPAAYRIEGASQLNAAVAKEAALLRDLLEAPVDSFSFHNTTPFTMGCRAPRYGGLLNAYAGVLQDHVSYVSDSNGRWTYRDLDGALDENHERLQVLTHPEWWTDVERPAAEKFCRYLEGRSRQAWNAYVAALHDQNRPNETGIPLAFEYLQHRIDEEAVDILRMWLHGACAGACVELARRIAETARDTGVAGVDSLPIFSVATRLLSGERVEDRRMAEAFSSGARKLFELHGGHVPPPS